MKCTRRKGRNTFRGWLESGKSSARVLSSHQTVLPTERYHHQHKAQPLPILFFFPKDEQISWSQTAM